AVEMSPLDVVSVHFVVLVSPHWPQAPAPPVVLLWPSAASEYWQAGLVGSVHGVSVVQATQVSSVHCGVCDASGHSLFIVHMTQVLSVSSQTRFAIGQMIGCSVVPVTPSLAL